MYNYRISKKGADHKFKIFVEYIASCNFYNTKVDKEINCKNNLAETFDHETRVKIDLGSRVGHADLNPGYNTPKLNMLYGDINLFLYDDNNNYSYAYLIDTKISTPEYPYNPACTSKSSILNFPGNYLNFNQIRSKIWIADANYIRDYIEHNPRHSGWFQLDDEGSWYLKGEDFSTIVDCIYNAAVIDLEENN